MIIEAIFIPFLRLYEFVIGLVPDFPEVPSYFSQLVTLLIKPLSLFPKPLWISIFTNITFWITIDFAWVIIEWLYKKLPGVD